MQFFVWTSADARKRTRTGYGVDVRGRWFKRIERNGTKMDKPVSECCVPDRVRDEYDARPKFRRV